ncbi:hypothetical protein NZD89_27245 [Alicyclobacillus fastidiosus]|uniref:Uncharacterized protein n=1 Tax=Alicyclobacillus fastidiosus TaxID=392011 RepID=A0ABY6ZGX7_9BACL|nr:hypothetical protein [Alicyclobacillus fastidiosus]WAH41853.1 hypothetical protein NZD89_27245 [Alicyclobacillus fastidiosus]GMA63557.1 hypothetical protein GCM10025859_39970 [Alicyclobacillus fastidiosus]
MAVLVPFAVVADDDELATLDAVARLTEDVFAVDPPPAVFAHPTKPTRQTIATPIPVTDFRPNTRFNPVPDTI